MATHPRRTVREAVVTLLTGASVASGRITDSNPTAVQGTLPACDVWTPEDEFLRWHDFSSRHFERKAVVTITCYVQANASAAATLDDLCRDVEAAIESDVTLSGVAQTKVEYIGTSIELGDENDPKAARADISYAYQYLDQG